MVGARSGSTSMVTDRLHLEAVRWVADIRADPHHRARQGPGQPAASSSPTTCSPRPRTQERAERLKVRLLEHPQFLASGMAVFDALKQALLDALADDDGPLRARATAELVAFGDRLGSRRAELRARLDGVGGGRGRVRRTPLRR